MVNAHFRSTWEIPKCEFIKVPKAPIRFSIHETKQGFIMAFHPNRIHLLYARMEPFIRGLTVLKTAPETGMTGTPGRWNTQIVLVVFCLFSAVAGCALPPWRVNPEWTTRAKDIRALLVVPAEVRIYQVSPGEMMQLKKDWSETGRRNLDNAILQGFRNRNYRVKLLKAEGEIQREVMRILPLFRAVNKSIQLHTYGPQIFPDKIADFDYSLGSLKGLLEKLHCDAMIFARGFDQVSKGARKTYMSLALADSSGTILWYGVKGSRGDHDLRDPKSAENLVDALLSDFQEVGR